MKRLSSWGLVLCLLGALGVMVGSGLGLAAVAVGLALVAFDFLRALLK